VNTAELFKERTVFSFEVYPAKKTASIELVYRAVDALSRLNPDYISVTYGAGGGAATAASTVEIASYIKNILGIEAVAHLPGMYLTREDVNLLLTRLRSHNIENVLALRGDRRPEDDPAAAATIADDECLAPVQEGDYAYASDLVRYIAKSTQVRGTGKPHFNIIAACYPEVHIEAPDAATDLRHLKRKVDAGANQLVTQLFFDNDAFYRFLECAREAGITVPIQAGIMPLTSVRQAEHIIRLCNPYEPPELRKMIDDYQGSIGAFRVAGIDYAVRQIYDLLERGVDGVHLYTMNDPQTAEAICSAIYPLLGR